MSSIAPMVVVRDRLSRLDRARAMLALRVAGFVAAGFVFVTLTLHPHAASDAAAYYGAIGSDPYATHVKGEAGAYVYSPAFEQLISPLGALPFTWFRAVLLAAELAALAWLAGPALVVVLLLPPVSGELTWTNINLLLAVAAVVGFRRPAAWAAILLTKITPGVGLLWFAFRREWRLLAEAIVATALVVAISFVLAPGLWPEWIRVLGDNARTQQPSLALVPLWARLGIAAALLAWAAPRNHRWAVPVAMAVTAVTISSVIHFVFLVGAIPLLAKPADRGARRVAGWLGRGEDGSATRQTSTASPAAELPA